MQLISIGGAEMQFAWFRLLIEITKAFCFLIIFKMKRNCRATLLLLSMCLSAFAQVNSVQVMNEHKELTDSLPGYSNIPVASDSEKILKQPTHETGIYKINPAVDVPIVALGTGWSLYAFTKIYKKGPSTEAQVLSLKTSDIPSFDRNAVRPYDKSLDQVSYYPFYGAMPLPFVFFLTGQDMRNDFWKLSFLYWETMS